MQTRKNDAVFPYNSEQDDGSFIGEPGLTKREYFAATILQGIIASGKCLIMDAPKKAVALADELVRTLNEPDE